MSSNTQFYRQCRLARGSARQTAWIPAPFAVEGRWVRLTEAGVSQDGGRVTAVGTRLAGDVLHERCRDYRHTRQASDV